MVSLNDMSSLLQQVSENAAKPAAEASGMPPDIYHSAKLLALEKDRIFKREWLCIGHINEIPNPGDYVAYDIGDQPVVAIRQQDNSIIVFSNVCLHRCARMLDGTGNGRAIVCPYHAWTYNLDGQLRGARFMEQTTGFDKKAQKLRTIRSEIWEGFIYATLSDDVDPVATRLESFQEVIRAFNVAGYLPLHSDEDIWTGNWKNLIENFMDPYHIFMVHKDSLAKYGSSEECSFMYEGDEYSTWHIVCPGEGDPEDSIFTAHPDNTSLQGDQRNSTVVGCVFPAHLIMLAPGVLLFISILPHGVGHFRMRWSVMIAPEVQELDNAEEIAQVVVDLFSQANSEDKEIVAKVFAGTGAHTAKPGMLSFLDCDRYDPSGQSVSS